MIDDDMRVYYIDNDIPLSSYGKVSSLSYDHIPINDPLPPIRTVYPLVTQGDGGNDDGVREREGKLRRNSRVEVREGRVIQTHDKSIQTDGINIRSSIINSYSMNKSIQTDGIDRRELAKYRNKSIQTDDRYLDDMNDENMMMKEKVRRYEQVVKQLQDTGKEKDGTIMQLKDELDVSRKKLDESYLRIFLLSVTSMMYEIDKDRFDETMRLDNDEIRSRYRRMAVTLNEREIEIDALNKKLDGLRDHEKENLMSELNAMKLRMDTEANNKEKIGSKDQTMDLSKKKMMEERKQGDYLKEDNARLKKEIVAVTKDRDAIADSMIKEHDKFREILKIENEKYKKKLKELADVKLKNHELTHDNQKMNEKINALLQKIENLENAENETDDPKDPGQLQLTSKFQGKEQKMKTGRTHNDTKDISKLAQDNHMLRNTIYEHNKNNNNNRNMIDVNNNTVIHNFLLSIEILRLLSILKRLTTSSRSDQSKIAPNLNMDSVGINGHVRLFEVEIDRLKKENDHLQRAVAMREMDHSGVGGGTGSVRSGMGDNKDNLIRLLKIENKKLNDALIDRIKECENYKRMNRN